MGRGDRGEPVGERNGIPVYRRPARRAPLRSREPQPQRTGKTSRLRASERLLAASQKTVRERSRGICERCQQRPAVEQQHRLPRGAGGSARNPVVNMPSNLLDVCRPCHAVMESERGEAYLNGWLVHRGQKPAEVPVTLGLPPFQHRFLLDDDGGLTVVEAAA